VIGWILKILDLEIKPKLSQGLARELPGSRVLDIIKFCKYKHLVT